MFGQTTLTENEYSKFKNIHLLYALFPMYYLLYFAVYRLKICFDNSYGTNEPVHVDICTYCTSKQHMSSYAKNLSTKMLIFF